MKWIRIKEDKIICTEPKVTGIRGFVKPGNDVIEILYIDNLSHEVEYDTEEERDKAFEDLVTDLVGVRQAIGFGVDLERDFRTEKKSYE
jgi:hypothetical protein